jgi:hypothetical protein
VWVVIKQLPSSTSEIYLYLWKLKRISNIKHNQQVSLFNQKKINIFVIVCDCVLTNVLCEGSVEVSVTDVK